MGFLALGVAAGLVAITAFRLAAVVGATSVTGLLATAYCLASAEIVVVTLALSPLEAVTRLGLLCGFAGVAAVTLLATRRPSGAPSLRAAAFTARRVLSDPPLAVLAVASAVGLAYIVALTVATPQNDFDTIHDHLYRAALWSQNHAVGYTDCACAPYVNAYPPVAEIGMLGTMALGGSARFAGLVQTSAYLAIVVSVVGIARRIGLKPPQAALGGLLTLTLPLLALQASTAQNDLVVAAFLLAATMFLLDHATTAPWLAGLATALAVGTKVTAPLALPILLTVAVLARPHAARRARVLAVGAGSVVGGLWYVVNLVQTGKLVGGASAGEPFDHSVAGIVWRTIKLGLQLIDLSGAGGRDLGLYAVTALALVAALAIAARRRGSKLTRGSTALLAGAVAVAPVALLPLARALERAQFKLWLVLGREDFAAEEATRELTRSASNWSWYGPLGSLLLVAGAVLVVRAARARGVDRLGVLFALAPLYWLVVFAAIFFYQPFAGRFFVYPMALAAATWGLVAARRWAIWGVTTIAATTLVLVLANDVKRPSGIRLLEPDSRPSYWSTPRSAGVGEEIHAPDLVRFVDERLPDAIEVGLVVGASDATYVVFGEGLDRRLTLLPQGARDAVGVDWVMVGRYSDVALEPNTWRLVERLPSGWRVYRRQ